MGVLDFINAGQAAGGEYHPCGEWVDGDGWQANPEAIEVGGTHYATLRRGPVRAGFHTFQLYYHNGRPWLAHPCDDDPSWIVVAALVVEPDARRKGHATEFLRWLQGVATATGKTLVVEASPIEGHKAKGQRTITSLRLMRWYASLGFVPKYPREGRSIMEWVPPAKSARKTG